VIFRWSIPPLAVFACRLPGKSPATQTNSDCTVTLGSAHILWPIWATGWPIAKPLPPQEKLSVISFQWSVGRLTENRPLRIDDGPSARLDPVPEPGNIVFVCPKTPPAPAALPSVHAALHKVAASVRAGLAVPAFVGLNFSSAPGKIKRCRAKYPRYKFERCSPRAATLCLLTSLGKEYRLYLR